MHALIMKAPCRLAAMCACRCKVCGVVAGYVVRTSRQATGGRIDKADLNLQPIGRRGMPHYRISIIVIFHRTPSYKIYTTWVLKYVPTSAWGRITRLLCMVLTCRESRCFQASLLCSFSSESRWAIVFRVCWWLSPTISFRPCSVSSSSDLASLLFHSV